MKKIILVILLTVLFMMAACESDIPLYKAKKTDNASDATIGLDYVINNYYANINEFEDKTLMNSGKYIKVTNDMLEMLQNCIESFIDTRFDIDYLDIQNSDFTILMESVDQIYGECNYEDFVQLVIDNEVVISVKEANILAGNYIKEYTIGSKTYYITTFDMILYTTSLNNEFFSVLPYYNSGDTIVKVYLLCEDTGDSVNIIQWNETYYGNTQTEYNFILNKI